MSYDMAFWYEEGSITASAASSKYDKMLPGAVGVAAVNLRLQDFYQAMIERYPDLTEETADVSPWTAPVDHTAEWIQVNISWPRSRSGLIGDLLDLAREYEITSYDPQSGVVYQPSDAMLKLSNGTVRPNPSEDDIRRAILALSWEKWFVILELDRERFIQVGLGPSVGVLGSKYVIEISGEGGRARQMASVSDVDQVILAFNESLNGRYRWQERHSWSPVT